MNKNKHVFNYKLLAILSIVLMIPFSCHKDKEDIRKIETSVPGFEVVKTKKGDLQIYVSDIDAKTLPGIEVELNGQTLKTDDQGLVQFKDVQLDANGTYIKINDPNYMFGSDKLYLDGSSNYSAIRLIPLKDGKSFASNQDVAIQVGAGAEVRFKANSIVKEGGETYEGEVTMYGHWLRAIDWDLDQKMPGALLALDNAGRTQVLESYGMLGVELRGTNNEQLNIKEGMTAEIKMPVPTTMMDKAPSKIPLWYFNEDTGFWEEEGEAALVNGSYIGLVSHFSYWNCDDPYDLFYLKGQILCNDKPLKWAKVKVVANGSVGYGYTNEEGFFGGFMPQGIALKLEISPLGCETVIHSTTVGPFTNNTVLDPINIVKPNELMKGKVFCNGNLQSTPLIMVLNANGMNSQYEFADGNIEFDLTQMLCMDVEQVSFYVYDPNSGKASKTYKLTDVNYTNFSIDMCTECALEAKINETFSDCGGKVYLEAEIIKGSGDYSFAWTNGTLGQNTYYEETGVACVNIYDKGFQCEQKYCFDITDLKQFEIKPNEQMMDCEEGVLLSVDVLNGKQPYSYVYTGPDGSTSTNAEMYAFNEGQYKLVVTDANGCEGYATFDVSLWEFQNVWVLAGGQDGYYLCDGEAKKFELMAGFDLTGAQITWKDNTGAVVSTETYCTIAQEGKYTIDIQHGICSQQLDIEVVDFPISSIGSAKVVAKSQQQSYVWYTLDIPLSNVYSNFYYDEKQYIEKWHDLPANTTIGVDGTGCSAEIAVERDSISSGITIDKVSKASCSSCEDGYVEFTVDNVVCSCDFKQMYLYEKGDYTNDLMDKNSYKKLKSGTYYLVGKAKNTANSTPSEYVVYVRKIEL